jgi:hypothetical protein
MENKDAFLHEQVCTFLKAMKALAQSMSLIQDIFRSRFSVFQKSSFKFMHSRGFARSALWAMKASMFGLGGMRSIQGSI